MKRLFIEIAIICGVVLAVVLAFLLPHIWDHPTSSPYEKYKKLYYEVENYDFSKGNNPELSSRLINEPNPNTHPDAELYFHRLARAKYYAGLELYNTALLSLEEAIDLAPNKDEYISTLREIIHIAHLAGDLEKESSYQQRLDRF